MKIYRSKKAGKQIHDTYNELLNMWNVDKEEQDIAGTYGSTHIITCGDKGKSPLVLFHGVGDNSALMWLYNAQALSRHFHIIAIDTIGGSGKSRPNENYNKEFDDAKWIDEVLSELALDKICIAGVSHGAFLAQYYALHRPERTEKILCMAGSVPVGNSSPMKTMMKIFLPEALFPTKQNTIKLLKKLSGENSSVFTESPIILEHYRALLKGFNNMAMAYHKVEPFSDEQVASIRDKALYLVGVEDPFAKLGGKNALIRYRMNAKFYPEAGHGINHEISDKINNEIIHYFSS
jgi:pimeloyl-ACP methyl ester carboxylesterase